MFSKMLKPLTFFCVFAVFCFVGHTLMGHAVSSSHGSKCLGKLTFDDTPCSGDASSCANSNATKTVKTEPSCGGNHPGWSCDDFESETKAGTVGCVWSSGNCVPASEFPATKYNNCRHYEQNNPS